VKSIRAKVEPRYGVNRRHAEQTGCECVTLLDAQLCWHKEEAFNTCAKLVGQRYPAQVEIGVANFGSKVNEVTYLHRRHLAFSVP